MTEGQPRRHRPSYHPKETEIDREAWTMEEQEIQLHKDAYWNLFMAYGFLMTSFFSEEDNVTVEIEMTLGKKEFIVDTKELFQKTIPAILTVEANRLAQMGQMDYVAFVNEMVRDEFGTKP